MNNPEVFETLKANIEATPNDQIQSPNMPMDAYNQEAENLYYWALADKEALMARGLDEQWINDLMPRVQASRHAQGMWFRERHAKQDAEREWKQKSPAGYQLRNQLLDEFEFAFYQNPSLMARLQDAKKGSTHSDMIQDLTDLALLGKNNAALLEVTNFDLHLLDQAIVLSDELARILAIANGEKAEDGAAKIMRDKAYTYLKEAVDQVRRVGRFVFRNNPERLVGYQVQYYKEHR